MVGAKRSAGGARQQAEEHDDNAMMTDDVEGLEFEDPYGDEFEEESLEDNEVDEIEEVDGEEFDKDENGGMQPSEPAPVAVEETAAKQVWRPGIDQLPEGEELEYDPSAYIMYHSMRTEWPCLSFDVVRDNLGDNRLRFPLTMHLIAGSQADRPEKNKLTLLQLKDLHKTYVAPESDDENDNDEDNDDDLDEDPTIDHVNINHYGGVNRIRAMPQRAGVVATWADTGNVHIYDLSELTQSMMTGSVPRPNAPTRPAFTSNAHRAEGFALDWCPTSAGRLVAGDCSGGIHVYQPQANGANWECISSSSGGFQGHTDSVEDVQWSPTEQTVFASCSVDRSIRIWDIRDKSKSQIVAPNVHANDINVISWNARVGYLLASGCDDGSFKVWDLRRIRTDTSNPLAYFTYHKQPVTSIQWNPHDESMLAVSSSDDQVSIWDLSVEADQSTSEGVASEYPPQLLFLHLGQKNVKELHFHPQIPGVLVSTAEDSFNIFKPAITVSS
jgi:ribosome assembly protein RRB1